jgi:tetratricopeptide (TPR) repeat protein
MRIADPLRAELARRLAMDHPARYRESASTFSEHARNGFHHRLAQVLGDRGATVTVAVLDLAAADKDSERSHAEWLLDVVNTDPDLAADASAAIRQLEQSPLRRPETDRLATLLQGLYEWGQGGYKNASEQFELVLSRQEGDRTEAIAQHLLGKYRSEQGDFGAGLLHLRTASDLLRKLGDPPRLAQALTSYGRALIDSAQVGAPSINTVEIASEQLRMATAALEEAVGISTKAGDDLVRGLALLELSRAEYASERIDAAIKLADDAAAALANHDRELLGAYTYTGFLYKEAGLQDRAREMLREAANLSAKTEASDLGLARLLSVQASADQRAGLTQDAINEVQESIAIGRRSGDRQHTAHALHTLAAVLLDLDNAEASNEAIEYLHESRAILKEIGDKKGIQMVEETLDRAQSLPSV